MNLAASAVCSGPLLPPGFAFSAESATLAQDGIGDTDVLVVLETEYRYDVVSYRLVRFIDAMRSHCRGCFKFILDGRYQTFIEQSPCR